MISAPCVRLREKHPEDAARDYRWQTDAELSALDAAEPLHMTYPEYLAEYLFLLKDPIPVRAQFAIETEDGLHIGNCACYGINPDKAEAEVGIMIGERSHWGKGYGSAALSALVKYAFTDGGLSRLHLKTLASNTRAQRCFRRTGFAIYNREMRGGYDFILMELSREVWQKRQPPAALIP